MHSREAAEPHRDRPCPCVTGRPPSLRCHSERWRLSKQLAVGLSSSSGHLVDIDHDALIFPILVVT